MTQSTLLAGDASASASLYLAGSSAAPAQIIALKTNAQPTWPTTQTVTFPLNTPVTATALGSVSIAMVPGSAGETWSIQSIQVVISNSTGTPPPLMLLNDAGSPLTALVTLSANNPSVRYPL